MKFLLELLSEEIPARMQAAAAEQLKTRFVDALKAAGLAHGAVEADATPRRLWLIAHDVAAASEGSAEELKGPASNAPAQAIEGFLKKTGLTREQLEERETPKGAVLFAVIRRDGRSAAAILAEAVPQIVRDFAWPKSMRWGSESTSTASPRWVRPLTGLVALLDGEVVPCGVHGLTAGRETRGHRVHAPAVISIERAETYVAQLRAAHVIASSAERRTIIAARAGELAAGAGLTLIPDDGLVAENAGLTEWPVPLLGRFDPEFLTVPPETIVLTMRTNQKYFGLKDAAGALAPAFVCVANLEASDGGASILGGNQRVLSARLSDARFFWEQDVAFVKANGLEGFLPRLQSIVFHEKLGTLADKVERVATLGRWLCESGAVPADPAQAEQAARLAKADLVSATVGEFPELQGQIGRYLALGAGIDPAIADALRDHYKPAGQGDDVPTAPVSVAVALADKLDTLMGFFLIDERPTGSKDPFALRRATLGILSILYASQLRTSMNAIVNQWIAEVEFQSQIVMGTHGSSVMNQSLAREIVEKAAEQARNIQSFEWVQEAPTNVELVFQDDTALRARLDVFSQLFIRTGEFDRQPLMDFFADRLKVQQREAGVRHDLIDAVFALGGEDDLVRLLARVKALQAFVETADGTNLLAGYKRAANILKAAEKDPPTIEPAKGAGEGAEAVLAAALDAALPSAQAAVAEERFGDAMTALSGLRAPVDAFFTEVMVNDPDPAIRARRLALLARFRDAVHGVADFSRIEG